MKTLRAEIAALRTPQMPWILRMSQQVSGLLWVSCAPGVLKGAPQASLVDQYPAWTHPEV